MSQSTPPPNRLVVDFGRLGSPLSIVLIGIGLLIIAIGANGIRSNGTVVQQMPYLLTGGVVGLAFVIFGCTYLLVQNNRQDRARVEAKLDAVIEALAHVRTSAGPAATPRDVSGLVVAGSASYHAPGCRLVDGREEVTYLTPAEARDAQLKPCRVCQPDSERVDVSVR
jgi:uncharacterized membrane protein